MSKKDIFESSKPVRTPTEIGLGLGLSKKESEPHTIRQELYSITDASKVLSIHPNIIRKAIRNGDIKAVSITVGSEGKQEAIKKTTNKRPTYRISRKELDRIIQRGI